MSRDLSDFLIELGSDPARSAQFAADPGGDVALAGLSREERLAVLSGDSQAIRAALNGLEASPKTPGRRNGGGSRNGGTRNGGRKRKHGGKRNGGTRNGGGTRKHPGKPHGRRRRAR
jgi:hypothetical protein